MRRFFRLTLLGFSWLFLAAIVVQVYFAGLMLFGREGGEGLHESTGYILGTAGVPVNALLIFTLSIILVRRATLLVRMERGAPTPASA
jgi:hypothetical protein